jgi:hypothetical protein
MHVSWACELLCVVAAWWPGDVRCPSTLSLLLICAELFAFSLQTSCSWVRKESRAALVLFIMIMKGLVALLTAMMLSSHAAADVVLLGAVGEPGGVQGSQF